MMPRPSTVGMEGKSLFTCSQCGALLKFKTNTNPIKERIASLRTIPIEATDLPDTTTEYAGLQQPAIIAELVWEHQEQVGEEAQWTHAPAPFLSANRGDVGASLEATIPNRLLSKPHLWLSDNWEVDTTLPECDADGWVYAKSFAELPSEMPLPSTIADGALPKNVTAVRRRRFVRRRQTDGSDLSWFQELLDCSSLLLDKKTPSCHDCEIGLIQNLQQTLNGLEASQHQYQAFLADFPCDNGNGHSNGNSWGVDADLEALRNEERRLQDELHTLEAESNRVMTKRRELWSTGADLEQLIRGTFAEGAFLQHLLGLNRDERQSVGVFSVHASDVLRRLQRYNVLNDVFHIWHDGLFGTINGLRLGRLPTRPVEWVEINAALGQAVLLLATIQERAQFEFTRNKLLPRGSYSRVINMYGKEYSLYSDGGMFRRRGFNQAMVLFLECVDDAGKRAMHEEPSLKLPYKITRGRIGELPVSLGNDEQWTKALKYMLTHLKWLLAWVAKRYA
ncbi:hypothetical protein Poli38472_010144 [Pythium oligandrum]|uniref:Uncharacterized protein n=1 Tax=Pythium oligandrum TaxID=41045 RepID=A0A8K1C8T5_PYTOL|nr:hypothetical protein Poli38472_010144 [Pythium oligandrum]|eukprot:TMW58585.1 hypothetical protein Poli38472_010144 [Pythium oligandrum]